MFEQALENCPPKFAKPLFLLYGKLEEEHGLAKRAMNVYQRATEQVADQDKFSVSRRCVGSTAPSISRLLGGSPSADV